MFSQYLWTNLRYWNLEMKGVIKLKLTPPPSLTTAVRDMRMFQIGRFRNGPPTSLNSISSFSFEAHCNVHTSISIFFIEYIFWINCAHDHVIWNEYDFIYLFITERSLSDRYTTIIERIHLNWINQQVLGESIFSCERFSRRKRWKQAFYEFLIYFLF